MDTSPRELSADTPAAYLRPLWRFKWVVLIVVAGASFGVYKYFDAKPRVYSTASEIYVGPSSGATALNGGIDTSLSDRGLANQARLVASPEIARLVKGQLNVDEPERQLLGAVTAVPDTGADFIRIQATGRDPRLIAAIANAFAQTYIRVQTQSRTRAIQSALREAKAQLATVRPRDLATQGGVLLPRVNDLESQLAAPEPAGEVTSAASVPVDADSPRPKRNAVFGGALAFILAVIGTFLFDRGDRRLRGTEDIEEIYSIPILASVPKVRHPAPVTDRKAEIPNELREAHRTLRVNIDLVAHDRRLNSLLVTSAMSDEGKSTVVRNLAFAYRDAGRRVVVVEADLRRPTLGKILGLDGTAGVAEVLTGLLSIEDALQTVEQLDEDLETTGDGSGNGSVPVMVPTIKVLTAGTTLVDPTTLLTTERFEPLLSRLYSMADIVLVDTPPVLAVGDTLPLLSLVDGLLLVARLGVTTSDAARRLRRTLDRVSAAPAIGAVVNAVQDDMAYGYSVQRPSAARASVPS